MVATACTSLPAIACRRMVVWFVIWYIMLSSKRMRRLEPKLIFDCVISDIYFNNKQTRICGRFIRHQVKIICSSDGTLIRHLTVIIFQRSFRLTPSYPCYTTTLSRCDVYFQKNLILQFSNFEKIRRRLSIGIHFHPGTLDAIVWFSTRIFRPC